MNAAGVRFALASFAGVRMLSDGRTGPSGVGLMDGSSLRLVERSTAFAGVVTAREGLERGDSWWADCPSCRCSGRVDLQGLVAAGRGGVVSDAMRCPRCKHPEMAVRVRRCAAG